MSDGRKVSKSGIRLQMRTAFFVLIDITYPGIKNSYAAISVPVPTKGASSHLMHHMI